MPNPLFDALTDGRRNGRGIALVTAGGDRWADDSLFDLSARFANVLVGAGVQPGDRCAVQVSKSPENLALYLACVRAGVIYLPLNTAYTEPELEYFVGDAEPAMVVVDPASREAGERLVAGSGARCLDLSAHGEGSLIDAAGDASSEHAVESREADDLAAILYTSGTTGRSKGAMLSQWNLLSNAQTLVDYWGFGPDDVLLHGLPIFHTHGLFVGCHVSLLSGGSMIFLPGFDADQFLVRMADATTMMGVPTFYTRLLADERFTRDRVAHMRLFVSGSAPMHADTHAEFERRTGQRVLERYGMTETCMNCSNPLEDERVPGTVGPPLPGVEVRVCDRESGERLPTGETGVLEVRGPNVFGGYWRMPEKTREEFREDGWFVTGDLATRDERGYVTIVGRDKDLIISGGYNVYPKEVERAIDEDDSVDESAVFGVPHPDFGEAVMAVVVPRDGGETLDTEALKATLGDRLARYKQPKQIHTIAELPRNTMGKVQKAELRERYAATFDSTD